MQPIPLSKPMTPELARAVYACLVAGCDAPEKLVPDFIREMDEVDTRDCEYRFVGSLRSGGKIFVSEEDGIYVTCYPEHQTPERRAAINRTMRALAVLMEQK